MRRTLILFLTCFLLGTGDLHAQRLMEYLGKPFFRNFSSDEYKGHNRNFGVTGDKEGRIFVANFEGVLVYDNATWTMLHTPDVSRILAIYTDGNGRVWFGGYNVAGYVEVQDYDLELEMLSTPQGENLGEVERIAEYQGQVCFYSHAGRAYVVKNGALEALPQVPAAFTSESGSQGTLEGHTTTCSTMVDGQLALYGTQDAGILAVNGNQVVSSLNLSDGLCSDNVTALYNDGVGNVWGTTPNGIFRISTEQAFTHFGVEQGLRGEVLSVAVFNPTTLLVGTLEGLYLQKGKEFTRLPGMNLACWQLLREREGSVVAATANGVFRYTRSGLQKISDSHVLSLLRDEEGGLYLGSTGHIHYYKNGKSEVLAAIPNVTNMYRNGKGDLCAMTINGEVYQMDAQTRKFHMLPTSGARIYTYTDSLGRTWKSEPSGSGLMLDGPGLSHSRLSQWLKAFKDIDVQVVLVKDQAAWLGGNFGLIRINLDAVEATEPHTPRMFLRQVEQQGRNLYFSYATDRSEPIGEMLYSYRLHEGDQWSDWSTTQTVDLYSLSSGNYQVQARVMTPYREVVESQVYKFSIPYPWYLRWYMLVFYALLALQAVSQFFAIRQRRLLKTKQQLEKTVEERTQKLQEALTDLQDTQEQLLRKQREATVGTLMKGLVDRILNPMNYINNFSHLTRGLIKDLKEDIDDEQEAMNVDNYDDCVDVLGMMDTNLTKIEEHGLATTRILKAMESLLNSHAGEKQPVNLNEVVKQVVETMRNRYMAEHVDEMGLEFQMELPKEPVIIQGLGDWLTRTLSSIFMNSQYGISKKWEHTHDFHPIIGISLQKVENQAVVTITDNGLGIEEQILDKVFDPFFTTKPTNEASGLGLYFVQRAVEFHQGTVHITSKKNELTTCTLTFPI